MGRAVLQIGTIRGSSSLESATPSATQNRHSGAVVGGRMDIRGGRAVTWRDGPGRLTDRNDPRVLISGIGHAVCHAESALGSGGWRTDGHPWRPGGDLA